MESGAKVHKFISTLKGLNKPIMAQACPINQGCQLLKALSLHLYTLHGQLAKLFCRNLFQLPFAGFYSKKDNSPGGNH